MLYFFYKIIIFRLNKEKDDIRSTYVHYNFFCETVNQLIRRQFIMSLTSFSRTTPKWRWSIHLKQPALLVGASWELVWALHWCGRGLLKLFSWKTSYAFFYYIRYTATSFKVSFNRAEKEQTNKLNALLAVKFGKESMKCAAKLYSCVIY